MMSPAVDTPLKTDTCSIGVKIPSVLAHNDASLATVSTKTGVLVYYYASRDVPSIRELTISGIPGSSQHPEAFTAAANAPIVAQPALATNTSQLSLYQPIGAGRPPSEAGAVKRSKCSGRRAWSTLGAGMAL